MKKAAILIFLLFFSFHIFAQDIVESPDTLIIAKKVEKKYKSIHMLGVKYSYNISGVNFTPSLGEVDINTPINISLLYTYYHDLWDFLPNFGLQFGVKYGEEGYSSTYSYNEKYKILEFPLISQFRIDFSRFRFLINIGTYYGYRLSTDKEGGFDQYDIRHDYGVIGGAGLGFVFNPFELHLEGNYKYSFCSVYHTNKISDEYWLFGYSHNIMISLALFIHLW